MTKFASQRTHFSPINCHQFPPTFPPFIVITFPLLTVICHYFSPINNSPNAPDLVLNLTDFRVTEKKKMSGTFPVQEELMERGVSNPYSKNYSETGISRHFCDPIEGPPETHRTRQYSTVLRGLRGALNQSPIKPRNASLQDSRCKFFQYGLERII